jgi:hypothetical protein
MRVATSFNTAILKLLQYLLYLFAFVPLFDLFEPLLPIDFLISDVSQLVVPPGGVLLGQVDVHVHGMELPHEGLESGGSGVVLPGPFSCLLSFFQGPRRYIVFFVRRQLL